MDREREVLMIWLRIIRYTIVKGCDNGWGYQVNRRVGTNHSWGLIQYRIKEMEHRPEERERERVIVLFNRLVNGTNFREHT